MRASSFVGHGKQHTGRLRVMLAPDGARTTSNWAIRVVQGFARSSWLRYTHDVLMSGVSVCGNWGRVFDVHSRMEECAGRMTGRRDL